MSQTGYIYYVTLITILKVRYTVVTTLDLTLVNIETTK